MTRWSRSPRPIAFAIRRRSSHRAARCPRTRESSGRSSSARLASPARLTLVLLPLASPAARPSPARCRSGAPPTTATCSSGITPRGDGRRRSGLDRLAKPVRALAHSQGQPRLHQGRRDHARRLVLGSDGWRPITKPAKDPKADAEFQAAIKLVPARQVRRGRETIRQDRQEPQGDHLGRERPVLPGRDPVSAEEVRSTPTTASKSCTPTTRRTDLPRRAGQPRVRDRAALAGPDRTQAPPKEKLSPGTAASTAGCPSSTPRARASRPSSTSATTDPDGPARRQGRDADRRVLYEASRLRVRGALLRSIHRRIPQEPATCRRSSTPRSTLA